MKTGSLFSGYAGLDMGVNSVFGSETAWFVEFDKGPSKILEHRFPGVPNHGDITTIDWSQVEPVDILTGGSPCQDLSHAGKRGGMTEGTRSNLWVAMREAIAQLRPTTVIWENVRGAFSASADSAVEPCPGCVGDGSGVHLRALGRVLGDLSDLGYDASWHGLRASDVGAAHGRFRVFIVATDTQGNAGRIAHRDSSAAPIAADLGHERAGRARDGWAGPADGDSGTLTLLPTPAAQEPGGTAEQYHARLKAHDGRDSSFLPLSMAVQLLPTPTTRDHKDGQIRMEPHRPDDMDTLSRALTVTLPRVYYCICGDTEDDACPEHGEGSDRLLLPTPKASVFDAKTSERAKALYSSKDSVADIIEKEQWGDYAAAIARWERVLGRSAPEPTVLSKKGSPQLSPAFVEWMMGLPAGWVSDVPGITRNEALKALGNGVVPQQCVAALRIMLAQAVAA